MKGLLIKEFYTKRILYKNYVLGTFILVITLPILRLLLGSRSETDNFTTPMSFVLMMSLTFQNITIINDIGNDFYKLANICPVPKHYIGKSKYILSFILVAIIAISYSISAILMNILFDYPVLYNTLHFDIPFILCTGNINFAITINTKFLGNCSDRGATFITCISMIAIDFVFDGIESFSEKNTSLIIFLISFSIYLILYYYYKTHIKNVKACE